MPLSRHHGEGAKKRKTRLRKAAFNLARRAKGWLPKKNAYTEPDPKSNRSRRKKDKEIGYGYPK